MFERLRSVRIVGETNKTALMVAQRRAFRNANVLDHRMVVAGGHGIFWTDGFQKYEVRTFK